jgi:hypothetical protein
VFLCLVVLELLLNAPRYAPPLLVAGVMAVVMIAPFFLDVRPPGSPNAPAFFEFQVRSFLPITLLFSALGIGSKFAWNLGYLLSLPLTYLCEFGVFFLGGVWWLSHRDKHPPEYLFRDHMIIGLMAISIAIPSIAWSGMEISNDLGFRGVLPAQFLLLFCAADFLTRTRRGPESGSIRRLRQVALVFLAIGVASTILEMVILRGAIGTTAKQTIQTGEMFRQDTTAERLAQIRDAYTWIRRNTPTSVVIQENPITWQMVALGQYSERRTAVYGSNPNYMVGEDHREFLDTVREVEKLYAAGTPWRTVVEGCARVGLGYVVVQSGDGAWMDRASYVWAEQPVFSNPSVRVFRCEGSIAR